MKNKINKIEKELDTFKEKIIFKLINNELIKLAKDYNNLLERKTMKKGLLPSEEILIFLDTIYDLLDDKGFLIEEKFNLFKKSSEIETKKKYKKLKKVSPEWKKLYLHFQILINLYKDYDLQNIFIYSILKDINKVKKSKIIIPKELINNKNNSSFTYC